MEEMKENSLTEFLKNNSGLAKLTWSEDEHGLGINQELPACLVLTLERAIYAAAKAAVELDTGDERFEHLCQTGFDEASQTSPRSRLGGQANFAAKLAFDLGVSAEKFWELCDAALDCASADSSPEEVSA